MNKHPPIEKPSLPAQLRPNRNAAIPAQALTAKYNITAVAILIVFAVAITAVSLSIAATGYPRTRIRQLAAAKLALLHSSEGAIAPPASR